MIRGSSTTVLRRVIVLACPLLVVCFLGLKGLRKNPGSAHGDVGLNFEKSEGCGKSVSEQEGKGLGLDFSPLAPVIVLRRRSDQSHQEFEKLVAAEDHVPLLSADLLSQLSRKERGELRSYLDGLNSSADTGRPWLCWGPDVSQAKLSAYHEVERMTGLVASGYQITANQFQTNGRWSKTATDGFDFNSQGDASIVTWSIVPDGTSTPGLSDQSSTGSNLRAWMASIYGGSADGRAEEQAWFAIFKNAFEEMAATCGLTLVYEPMDDGVLVDSSNTGAIGVRGDIRVAARGLDGNSGNLAIAFPPDHGDMIFDSSDGTFLITSGDSIRLFNTITHELGHALGLAHVCPVNQTKLLEPSLTTGFRGPQFDEFQSLQRLYGDRFEAHGEYRDNDTAEAAKVINLVEGSPLTFSRLSIDDDRDRDFYRFEGIVGQRLNVEVIPGEGSYLEGGETSSGCSQGIEFDSAANHNLSVQVLGDDGETVIFEAASGALGEPETIQLFELPRTGIYYLRVDGDLANATQIYELRTNLMARLPAPRLRLVNHRVLEESGSVKNARLDPGETIRLAIEIENEGELPTGALTTRLLGVDNAVVFSESGPVHLDPGESGVIEVVVGTTGSCGEIMVIVLEIADASGGLLGEVLELEAGVVTRPIAFDVDFEGLDHLPLGWDSGSLGSGEAWTVASSRSDARFQSAFTPARASVGEAILLSPAFELASSGGTLSFRHLYRLEPGFDGAVLEVSRDGGEWTDLMTDPDVIVTGGYNRGIRAGFGSAIAGRQAWSGLLETSSRVSVDLPVAWAGELIQFRWRAVHDASSAREGWWIDEVRMELLLEECEAHRPEVFLTHKGGELNESNPHAVAILALETNLPLVSSLNIPLEVSGTATFSEDYLVDREAVLPAGEVSLEIPIAVVSDLVSEGEETVLIRVPPENPAFLAGSGSSVQLTIFDLLNVDTWSAEFFGGAVDLLGDSDGDGFDELSEYVLGTSPVLAGDRPVIALLARGGKFLLPLDGLPDRRDASLGIEFSSDLKSWEVGESARVAEGLEITPMTGKRYFRLTFSLN